MTSRVNVIVAQETVRLPHSRYRTMTVIPYKTINTEGTQADEQGNTFKKSLYMILCTETRRRQGHNSILKQKNSSFIFYN